MYKQYLKLLFFSTIFLYISCDNENPSKTIEPKEQTEKTDKPISEITILDSLIKKEPKNANLYFKRAKFYYNQPLFPKSLINILAAIKLDSSVVDYYSLAGDIFIEMNQGKDAVGIINNGIAQNPKSEVLFTQAIEYQIYLADFKKGLTLVNDLLRINENNADAYFFKGLIYKNLKNYNKSISSFQTCVEQDPTFYNAYMQLGLLFSKKQDDLAINYFNNALKLNENSREAMYGKAYHFQEKKEYNNAKVEYGKMIQKNRNDYQAFYNFAYCYMEQDSLKKAYSNFGIAARIKVDYVDAIFMQGQIAERIGDIKNAKIHYNIALKMLPNNQTITEALNNLK